MASLPPDAPATLYDPAFTTALDKVICMRGAYFAHVTFCYLVFLSGIACFVSRVVPRARFLHAWFGRAYIIFMLWATGTSLVIHNTGLPAATLVSFIWVLGGLTIAWLLIKVHEARMQASALALLAQQLAAGGAPPRSGAELGAALGAAKCAVAERKTFAQRLLSLKAAHGSIMFVSWINIAGRIFASNQSGDFTCHTYPAFKPITTSHFAGDGAPLTLVPAHDPRADRLPWTRLGLAGWGAVMLLAPSAAALAVGACVSWAGARRASRHRAVAAGGGASDGHEAVEAGHLGKPGAGAVGPAVVAVGK